MRTHSLTAYKQSSKRNACGFHFLCVWVMNTDIFSHEFCYEGASLVDVTVILMLSHSTAFHCGRRLICTFKEASPCKDCKRIKYRILYTTLYLYCAVMYVTMQPYQEYISECRFVNHTQAFSVRSEVNRAIEPHQTLALKLLLVCYFHIHLAYHCILYL